MKTTLLALTVCSSLAATSSHAAISFTGSYSEDFNGLPVSGGSTTLDGTASPGSQVSVPGLSDWQVAKVGGNSTANTTIHTSPLTGGRFYSYGAVDAADRALGSLGSGSFWGAYGTSLVNATPATITSIVVTFTREIWTVQGTSTQNLAEDRVAFAYGFSGGDITAANYLTNGSMISVPDLDLVSVEENTITGTNTGTDPNRSRDGNSPEWSQLTSATISDIEWAPGQEFHIRWSDQDSPGFDAGLAVDNLTVEVIPEPSFALLIAAGLVGLCGLRRRL